MLTRFGHEQIARDRRALRRLEATECVDVEARLLRHGHLAADAGAGPGAEPPGAAAGRSAERAALAADPAAEPAACPARVRGPGLRRPVDPEALRGPC